MDPPRLRVYVTCELAILAVLTAVFLLLFPRRPTYLDVGLAILALALLAMNARFTRQAVWGRFPSIGDKPARRRACLLRSGAFTSCVAIAFLAIGLALGHHQGGWRSAWLRVGNWHIAL